MPKKDETKIVVKPIGALGGLDSIHLALMVLVAILIVLLLMVTYSKPIGINATSNLTCSYGAYNGSCVGPVHNISSVKRAVGQILASYAGVNASLSILPYFSYMQNANVTYVPTSKQWLATVPAKDPTTNNAFDVSFLLYDSNLTLARPYIQTATVSKYVKDYVVSQGVVRLNGKSVCLQSSPVQVYWFIDPYAFGSISTLNYLSSLKQNFASKVNASVDIVSGSASLAVVQQTGNVSATQALGKYIVCASKQSNFTSFVSTLQSVYANGYVPPSLLSTIVNQSKLDKGQMASCLANITSTLNAQALLAQYYNVTSTPSVITNCVYQSIPQTAKSAVCYATNSTSC